MISLKDALDTMNKLDQFGKPVPFSCVYCTFSRQRKAGGELIKIEQAIISKPLKKSPQKKVAAVATNNGGQQTQHFLNKTRNIKLMPSGEIRKFRIRMLLEFNGQQVVY